MCLDVVTIFNCSLSFGNLKSIHTFSYIVVQNNKKYFYYFASGKVDIREIIYIKLTCI